MLSIFGSGSHAYLEMDSEAAYKGDDLVNTSPATLVGHPSHIQTTQPTFLAPRHHSQSSVGHLYRSVNTDQVLNPSTKCRVWFPLRLN
ncbi:hypothetical protein PAXRUDRAFT_832463 [Paxillus rubicundulus Ve08.2h10]|uniref:Uncharacterized protein n=1 Tax=Paxillus rubicundulus Ve08.2h10 TaxID=930991 RepID=A0A0D0D1T6_9AGAM|nr:hypothetical protein PAXRUDRAFT_832463 [Paxillus rubicundulus Ve08.2h10]